MDVSPSALGSVRIERRSINALLPADYNPREITDVALHGLGASIDRFGLVQPIVLNERTGNVVGGHQRLKVLQERGVDDTDVVLVDVDEAEEKALNLALNSGHISGQWTADALGLLEEVAGQLPDLSEALRLGELHGELESLFPPAPTEVVEDEIPGLPDEAATKPGDLWILGNHRLLCGDSSSEADLDRLLDGADVHLLNCDPPYNVKVEPRSNNAIAAGMSSFTSPTTHHQQLDVKRHPSKSKATHKQLRAKDRPLANDFMSEEEFDALLLAWFGNASRVLLPGRSFFIWGGYANLANYPAALRAHDLYFSQAIVWDKQHPVLTRKDMMGAFELAFYGWKKGAGHQFFGPNNATDLWPVKKVNPQSMVHLTEKPVALAVRAIEYSSRKGENVLDLFGGSGSTLIGCEQTGRNAYLMELDALYCDVICQRYENLTGQKAVLEGAA